MMVVTPAAAPAPPDGPVSATGRPPAGGGPGTGRLRHHEGVAVRNRDPLDTLADWLAEGDIVVLSGAGLSIESGIPDYRGPSGAARRGAPMTLPDVRLRPTPIPPSRQAAAALRPDGDAEVADAHLAAFRVVDCDRCGRLLKPDVVYFGENVPSDRIGRAFAHVSDARTVLVLGSSLTVMSGRRFVLRAARDGIRVAIVNQGVTRGDAYAALTVDAPLGPAPSGLAGRLAVD